MTRIARACTFAVSRVPIATELLPELPYHEAMTGFLNGPVESCSRYHGKLVANVVSNPLIAALHGGFATHRPVALSPDIVWLAITQGLATHINLHAETLRPQFVSHDDKLTLVVRRDDFIKGAPENPWPEVFPKFAEQIHVHIGGAHELVVADFSTTGEVERAVSELVLLDSMQSYFDYEVHTYCGIPEITLEGTVEDWRSIESRVAKFSGFGLNWWIGSLRPLLQQFIDAANGVVDQEFWNSIYKYQGPQGSGSPCISGWITKLFPYLMQGPECYERNPWLDEAMSENGPSREAFPNAISKVPFLWRFFTEEFEMEFVGGLVGVSQCRESFTLRPEIGWAVRDAPNPQAADAVKPRPSNPSCLL